jgi:hypothetical protein
LDKTTRFKSARPWRNGLLATTSISLLVVLASVLWNAGHAQWAFLLVFLALWLFISLSWSNDRFIEQSGTLLARIVDHNFQQVHERMEFLERELLKVQNPISTSPQDSMER